MEQWFARVFLWEMHVVSGERCVTVLWPALTDSVQFSQANFSGKVGLWNVGSAEQSVARTLMRQTEVEYVYRYRLGTLPSFD